MPPKDRTENNAPSDSVVGFDQFISTDDVSAVWASGLQVYLRSRGGNVPRTIPEWRLILSTYKNLG